MWALIGPGLSDPGHIEIHSRTVYLDSETLLGSRAEIAAGALERRAILRCFGVALHETFHAKHTKRWAIEHDIALSESDDPDERQLAVDRRLLEEPRMEAHGVREFPPTRVRGRFVRRALQAAVHRRDPARVRRAAARPALLGGQRDAATSPRARTSTCTRAPTTGSSTPRRSPGCRRSGARSSASRDLRALDDLYARLIWIPDGELDGSTTRRASTGESSASPTRHRARGGAARGGRIR